MKTLFSTTFALCFTALLAAGCAEQDASERGRDVAPQEDGAGAAEGAADGLDPLARPCLKCVGCSTTSGYNACCDVIEVNCGG
jgi:hypothetical protein